MNVYGNKLCLSVISSCVSHFCRRNNSLPNEVMYLLISDVVGRGGGGYRGGGIMLPHGGGLPSPRGMLRGTATGVPMMSRGSPSKASPAWGGRNMRQPMHGRPTFVRGSV